MLIILDSTGDVVERIEDAVPEPATDLGWQALSLSLSLETHSSTKSTPDED